jgi:hypothetical protein
MQYHSTFSFKWNLIYSESYHFFNQLMVVHSSKEPNLNNSVMPINSLFEVLHTKNEVLKQLNLVSEFFLTVRWDHFLSPKKKKKSGADHFQTPNGGTDHTPTTRTQHKKFNSFELDHPCKLVMICRQRGGSDNFRWQPRVMEHWGHKNHDNKLELAPNTMVQHLFYRGRRGVNTVAFLSDYITCL